VPTCGDLTCFVRSLTILGKIRFLEYTMETMADRFRGYPCNSLARCGARRWPNLGTQPRRALVKGRLERTWFSVQSPVSAAEN
jgi:hypothetical protein